MNGAVWCVRYRGQSGVKLRAPYLHLLLLSVPVTDAVSGIAHALLAIALPISLKKKLRLLPKRIMPIALTIEMNAIIKAYSVATAANLFFQRQRKLKEVNALTII